MFHDPIEKRFFKADVLAGFFALDPFVFQNFLSFGQELFVEHGVLDEVRLVLLGRWHWRTCFHKNENQSTRSALIRKYDVASAIPIEPNLISWVTQVSCEFAPRFSRILEPPVIVDLPRQL